MTEIKQRFFVQFPESKLTIIKEVAGSSLLKQEKQECIITFTDMDEILERCLGFHELYPFDAVHDRVHHENVLANIGLIVEKEKLENKLDKRLLMVAACIHDAVDEKRGEIEPQTLQVKEYLRKKNIPQFLVDGALEIVLTHSFGKEQTSLSQKVLYDADKLEYSNPSRMDSLVKALEEGKMDKEKVFYYLSLWKERVPVVASTLSFDSSKKTFDDKTKNFVEYIKDKYPNYYPYIKDTVL